MIPTIDPSVKYRGASFLRELSTENLRTLEGVVVIQDAEAAPMVVIVPIDTYVRMQRLATGIGAEATLTEPLSKSVTKRLAAQGANGKKPSRREAAIQERAAGDIVAQKTERDDIDYSDVESTPTTHVAMLDATGPPLADGMGKVTTENWRANRKPLLKPKDRKKE
jgi:hypothetical protein